MTGSVDGSRAEILARIGHALDGAPGPVPVQRRYRTAGEHPAGSAVLVELLADRLRDYRAHVHPVVPAELAAAIATITRDHAGPGARLLVAPDFPKAWRSGWPAFEDHGLRAEQLDGYDGAVTTCAVAIAETGTLVLDAGAGQGRRAITLVPDLHICLVAHEQIVHTVPDALRRLDPRRPLTMISGPSATSDIELQRVEGVHGPRSLHVLLFAGSSRDEGGTGTSGDDIDHVAG
jgi:L-lactate dehydrogenase complex protein LldG